MIVTEEEARTKWCPETRKIVTLESAALSAPNNKVGIASANRAGEEGRLALGPCIGSSCMAWRWVVADRTDTYGREDKDKGYCGKAGRP